MKVVKRKRKRKISAKETDKLWTGVRLIKQMLFKDRGLVKTISGNIICKLQGCEVKKIHLL